MTHASEAKPAKLDQSVLRYTQVFLLVNREMRAHIHMRTHTHTHALLKGGTSRDKQGVPIVVCSESCLSMMHVVTVRVCVPNLLGTNRA